MKRITIQFILLLFVFSFAYGQAGYLDKTFGDEGEMMFRTDQLGMRPDDIKVLPDGKIVHCGLLHDVDGAAIYVMKHHADGKIDTDFGKFGYAKYRCLDNFSGRLLSYPDGRMLVFGSRNYEAHTNAKPTIVRFLPNGSVDSSFGSNGEYDGSGFREGSLIARVKVLGDGSIIALGSMNRTDSLYSRPDPVIVKITPEGKNDSSFGVGGVLVIPVKEKSGSIYDALFCRDGKYVFGYSTTVDGKSAISLLRLKSNGTRDSSFGSNGESPIQLSDVTTYISHFVENSGNDILCVVQRNVAITPKSLLMQFKDDGSLDESFGGLGVAQNIDSLDNKYFPYCTLDSSNNIILLAQYSEGFLWTSSVMARYHRDGMVDSSFGVNGVSSGVRTSVGLVSAAVQSDGKYVAIGYQIGDVATNYVMLYRFNNSGGAGISRDGVLSSPISIHPTPSLDNCTVTYTLPTSSDCSLTLRDESGREVKTYMTSEYKTAGKHEEELDLRGLASGVYFLEIGSGGTIQTTKLIKQ